MSYLQAATLFALTALVSAVEVAQAAVPTELTYMGRLIDATGKPIAGPVDLEAAFYRSADGGDAVGGTVLQFPGVTLNKGVFQIGLKLTDSEMNIIFDNSSDVYVQIVDKTNRKTYARQKYGVVPYALKVPTDNSTIVYDSSGRLTLGKRPSIGFSTSTSGTVYLKPGTGSADGLTYTLPASPVAGQFLTTDATGTLSWTPMASVSISTLPTGVNANQIPLLGTGGTLPAVDGSLLTNLNGSRLSASSLNLSTSTAVAGTLPIALGGTGLASTPANGQLLIGNGTGFTLAALTGGTGINVASAAGSITLNATADASLKLTKAGDTMTGVLNLPANGLVAGTNQLVLSGGGNVGIGSATPAGTLDVQGGTNGAGTSGINIILTAQNGGSGTASGGNIILTPGTANGTGTVGRVGIGSASPTATLDVNGTARALGFANQSGTFLAVAGSTAGTIASSVPAAGLILLTSTGAGTITTVAGCNSGTIAQGQIVNIVAASWVTPGFTILTDTGIATATADSMALAGNSPGTLVTSATTVGSSISLLCTTIAGIKKWIEMARSLNAN
ncbi:MAG: hypothetical protein NTZ90_08510 [Proteobacteria bacterium]|nr:hypothetical protein [Pseudomonadota bacterium]